LAGAKDRLEKHAVLMDQLRIADPSPALDLGMTRLAVFERIIVEPCCTRWFVAGGHVRW
jgi:hypothetical protein